jgi:hydrogenase maturation protease
VTPRVRVLACGSYHGGDDAAALEALKLLPPEARERASLEEVLQLSAEQLLDDEPGTRRVVVDCVHGIAPGEIVELPLVELPAMERRLGVASSHALGVGQAVALADALGGLRSDDRFLGIGGARYAQGAVLSREVADGLPELAARIGRLVTGGER